MNEVERAFATLGLKGGYYSHTRMGGHLNGKRYIVTRVYVHKDNKMFVILSRRK